MESILSEERWARLIENVRQVSEANNSRDKEEMEDTVVFKIIKTSSSFGFPKYEWKYFENDTWIDSDNWFDTKGACLVDFITERGNLQINGIDEE